MTISEITPASFADDGFALGFTQNVTRTVHAGSYVAALVTQGWAGGAVQTLTMSDDKGGTWSAALDVLTSSGHQQLAAQFYRTTPFSTSDFGGSGSGSVTFTLTSTDNGGAKGLCIREIAGSSGVDTHTGALQDTPPTSTDGASSGTLTPSSQPLLLLGTCIDVPGNQDPSVGTGFTDAGSGFNYGGSPNSTRAESKRLTSTSAVAATFTVGASETLFTHAIVFNEVGAKIARTIPRASVHRRVSVRQTRDTRTVRVKKR